MHMPMILRFGAELGYQGPPDAFILSENLTSTLEEPAVIDKKLTEDLAMGRVVEVEKPTPLFISSLLGLVQSIMEDGGESIIFLTLEASRSMITSQMGRES